MTNEKYLTSIQELENRCSVKTTSEVLGDYEKTYVVSRANLKKLLPEIPETRHEQICRDNYYFKILSSIHAEYVDILKDVKYDGDLNFLKDINNKPRIFCTFHMGSYRLMNLVLAYHNINFALVISKKTLGEQKESYMQSYRDQKNKYGTTGSFEFIEAENPTSIISMIRMLKSGKSLLFYIDGNTGVGGVGKTDENMLSINFLNNPFFARKGISFLSHKCNVSIINCFTIVNDKKSDVTSVFNTPIVPDRTQDVSEYSLVTTQKIYDEFSEILRKYPEQWEGWMYVNRYLDIDSFTDKEPGFAVHHSIEYTFNEERYKPFTFKLEKYLFDFVTYNTYPVSAELIDILISNHTFKLDDQILNEDTYSFLINKKILKPV